VYTFVLPFVSAFNFCPVLAAVDFVEIKKFGHPLKRPKKSQRISEGNGILISRCDSEAPGQRVKKIARPENRSSDLDMRRIQFEVPWSEYQTGFSFFEALY